MTVEVELELAADFAHVFDVKSGAGGGDRPDSARPRRWTRPPRPARQHRFWSWNPRRRSPTRPGHRALAPARGRGEALSVTVTVQPVSAGVAADLEPTSGLASGVAIRSCPLACDRPDGGVARPAAPAAVDQALADLAALRIVDRTTPTAPWSPPARRGS